MTPALVDALDRALPQTQCTRCGYPNCRTYAEAMAAGEAGIDRCPPGGEVGVARLAALTGRPPAPLDPARGAEGPRLLAVIDEAACIGCTLCLKACPVDSIVGAAKRMHTVLDELCTGCELCVPVCPVDCISLTPVTPGRTGWDAWSPAQADEARERHAFHWLRLARDRAEHDARLARPPAAAPPDTPLPEAAPAPAASDAKRAILEAAMARARARRPLG